MAGSYTTIQGDLWDTIAYRKMGSTKYVNLLMEANLQYREYFIFPAGITLTVPDVPETAASSSLPPWKQG